MPELTALKITDMPTVSDCFILARASLRVTSFGTHGGLCSDVHDGREIGILGSKTAGATLPVSDMQRARDFYENTVGLEPLQEDPGSILYKSGNSVLLVYPSEYAGTNQATAATWAVGDDLESIVEDLRRKGVTFEHRHPRLSRIARS